MKEKDILKKVRLLGDRVLIKEDESLSEKKTSQGIIIPVTVSNDKGSKQGKVLSVGCLRQRAPIPMRRSGRMPI
jgi:co-chaperonin GroES (HSP10)